MKKYTFLLIVFWISVVGMSQKSDILLNHYQNEFETFKEFVKYGETIKGDTNIDVKFYYINIEIGIESPFVGGDVTCLFEPLVNNLDEVVLNLNSALTVDAVSAPCESFYQDGDLIYISLQDEVNPGELVELTISYQGVPVMAGGYKGMRYETHGNNEPIIATLSTPYLAHYWYPCKDGPQDKPDSVYMDITIPDEVINGQELMAISNGLLEYVIDNGDTKTFQWRHRYPVVTYYVMAAVSNYTVYEDEFNGTSGESFPLLYYVFQESLPVIPQGVEDMPDVIQFYSDVFGTYPFSNEKYGMTELGFYGAIENQTNTIQNNLSLSWFDVTIHELAHMWFGDMVTCADWHHGWLNEGFASYAEALWYEHVDGFEGYKQNMENNEFWNAGTLYLQNAQDTFNTFPAIIYAKGAYVVHMLRGVVGDDVFFDALMDYTQHPDFKYKNASTEDLQGVFETASGLDLNIFFEQWVYDERYPFYYYNYLQNSENEVAFVIHQAQEELYGYRPVFEMPVRVQFNFDGGGDTTLTFWNDQQTQTYFFELDEEISSVELDPDKWILRKTLFDPGFPVSVNEKIIDENFLVYPNPFTQQVNIEFNHELIYVSEIQVLDLQGRLVKVLPYNKGMKISWDGTNDTGVKVDQGMYFIEIKTSSNTYLERVLLQD